MLDVIPILEVSIITKPISLFFNMLQKISLFFAAFYIKAVLFLRDWKWNPKIPKE